MKGRYLKKQPHYPGEKEVKKILTKTLMQAYTCIWQGLTKNQEENNSRIKKPADKDS